MLKCSCTLTEHVCVIVLLFQEERIIFIDKICVKVSALSVALSEVQQSHRMDKSETAARLRESLQLSFVGLTRHGKADVTHKHMPCHLQLICSLWI